MRFDEAVRDSALAPRILGARAGDDDEIPDGWAAAKCAALLTGAVAVLCAVLAI